MEWTEFIKSCEEDRKITILSFSKFRKIIGKPERIYVESNRIHIEYGRIGGNIVNKDFTDSITMNTVIYWLTKPLPIRKGRRNSLTVIYRVCILPIENPIIC